MGSNFIVRECQNCFSKPGEYQIMVLDTVEIWCADCTQYEIGGLPDPQDEISQTKRSLIDFKLYTWANQDEIDERFRAETFEDTLEDLRRRIFNSFGLVNSALTVLSFDLADLSRRIEFHIRP